MLLLITTEFGGSVFRNFINNVQASSPWLDYVIAEKKMFVLSDN